MRLDFLIFVGKLRMFEQDTSAVCSRNLAIHQNSEKHFGTYKFPRSCLLLAENKHSKQSLLSHTPSLLLDLEVFQKCR